VPVPNLHWVIEDVSTDNAPEARGGELVLMRTVGTYNAANPLANAAPGDAFDFTGLYSTARAGQLSNSGGGGGGTGGTGAALRQTTFDPNTRTKWHYVRSSTDGADNVTMNTTPNWKFVYP